MQCAQRLALIGITDRQYGHSLVVGSPGLTSLGRRILFIERIIMNITKATIRKVMI